MANGGRGCGLAVVAWLLWLASGLTSTAQTGSQAPVFKGRLDLVRTEVAVIDNKTGKAVTGLTERDFAISENGTRQTITSFVDQSVESAAEVSPPAATAIATADPDRRVFLFIVAVGQGDGPYKVYEGLSTFIRERLRPQDLAAVMTMNRVTQLTTDHERLAAIVERMKTASKEVFEARLRDRFRGINLSPETEALIDGWLEPSASAAGFLRDATPFLLGTPEFVVNEQHDVIRDWKNRLAGNDVLKAVAGIEYLRRIQGEKHVVLVTAMGFNPPFHLVNEGIALHFHSAEDDRRLAARANDAGVAVDIIHTGGADSGAFAIMSLKNVSEHSGGLFSGVRTAPQQLARLDDASRNGYILGYVPRNPELDNKYRDVSVAVNRKGVTVVYRRGHTATSDPGHIDSKEVHTRTRMGDAATGNVDLTDIRVTAKASSLPAAGANRQVRVDVTIDVSQLVLTETAGKWEGEIDLLILCGDRKQDVVGKIDQHMTLSMTPAMFEKAKAGGVPYSATIPVVGQASLAKVIVYQFDSDRLGTAAASIR
jgi:VWFA-related protein